MRSSAARCSTNTIEVAVCERAEDVYKGADIVAALTDSAVPVLDGRLIENGTHIISVSGGRPDDATLDKVDIYLRFGSAPAPWTHPELGIAEEFITYAAQQENIKSFGGQARPWRGST